MNREARKRFNKQSDELLKIIKRYSRQNKIFFDRTLETLGLALTFIIRDDNLKTSENLVASFKTGEMTSNYRERIKINFKSKVSPFSDSTIDSFINDHFVNLLNYVNI